MFKKSCENSDEIAAAAAFNDSLHGSIDETPHTMFSSLDFEGYDINNAGKRNGSISYCVSQEEAMPTIAAKGGDNVGHPGRHTYMGDTYSADCKTLDFPSKGKKIKKKKVKKKKKKKKKIIEDDGGFQ